MASTIHTTDGAAVVQGPKHFQGMASDRRPRFGDDPAPGVGSTFTCLDTGDVDVFDGTRWIALNKFNAIEDLLELVVKEQRETNALLQTLLAHSVS